MKELTGYVARHRTELENGLTEAQKELLDKYVECRSEQESHILALTFEYGFKLGAKMMLQMLSE